MLFFGPPEHICLSALTDFFFFFTAAFLYCLEKLRYIVETGLLLVLIGIKCAVQLLYTDSGLAHLWSRWAVTVAK